MLKVDAKEEDPVFTEASSNSAFRCENCIACFRVSDCEKCPNCLAKISPCLRRVCVQAGMMAVTSSANESNNTQNVTESPLKSAQNAKKEEQKKRMKKKEAKISALKKLKAAERLPKVQEAFGDVVVVPKRKPHKPHKPHVWRPRELRGIKKSDEIAQQCYGPNCAKAARPSSKYCSDDCGLILADHRLKYILRGRVADFYRLQPVSEKTDDKKIRELTVKKAETESDLDLAHKYAEIFDLYISSLCKTEAPQGSQLQTSTKQTPSFSLFCPVCGRDFLVHKFLRHVESCSSDQERKFVYGSKYSLAENPHEIVCDQYDSNTQTFCKRLRFACAEHYNDLIGSEMKICGYPLKWKSGRSMRLQEMFANLEEIISDGICMKNRNSCQEHHFWEQNVRALLDNHRMRLILYLDDLATEYYHIFESYRTRGDALTLLVNSRQLSRDANIAEDSNYRSEQMSAAGFLIQKQEELSVENLYHTIRASRSAKASSSSTSSQTTSNGILDSSILLNSVNNDLINLLPLLQNTIQTKSDLTSNIDSLTTDYNSECGSSAGLRSSTCFPTNENSLGSAMEALVRIEQ